MVVFDSELGAWVVGSRELAIRVLRDDVTFTVDDPRFSTARVVGPSMLSLDGAEHRRHRSPFVALTRPTAALTSAVDGEARRLVAQFGPVADLMAELAAPLAAWTAGAVLGLDADPVTLLGWYREIVAETERLALDTAGTACRPEAVDALRDAVLASDLVADLSDDEVASNAAVVLFGAIETTEGMIGNLFVHLLTEPGVLDAVRADRSIVEAAIEESLRLEPSVTRVDRFATTDIELDGQRIERGDFVVVSLALANRDPVVHAEPDRFRLDRVGEPGHLTFVQGPHACIGAQLARSEAHAAVAAVLDAHPRLTLADHPVVAGTVFRKPPSIMVR